MQVACRNFTCVIFVSGTYSASNCKSNWDETHCEENDHLLHRNILIMAFRELCANLVWCRGVGKTFWLGGGTVCNKLLGSTEHIWNRLKTWGGAHAPGAPLVPTPMRCSNRHEDSDGYFTSSFSKMFFSCLDLFWKIQVWWDSDAQVHKTVNIFQSRLI